MYLLRFQKSVPHTCQRSAFIRQTQKIKNVMKKYLILIVLASLYSCTEKKEVAPGAPGNDPTWAFSGKTGIGTSYEAYKDGKYQENEKTGKVSKVWFSIAKGVLTETMWGLIHQAQIKDMQLVIKGNDFVDIESQDAHAEISYLTTDSKGRPTSLAYKVLTKDKEGHYEIEKHIFTHPENNALFVRYLLKPQREGIEFYLSTNPHIANTGTNDFAEVTAQGFHAWEGDSHLSMQANITFEEKSVGFVGASDGVSSLRENGQTGKTWLSTGEKAGNVSFIAKLPNTDTAIDIAVGFGKSREQSDDAANKSLNDGYQKTLAMYVGEGDAVGWQDYLESLQGLKEIRDTAMDGGKLAHVSALVLKAQEDKTHAGALIASLSNPWGDTIIADRSSTGYKAVWPRDFYQCAMALLALGDRETPKVAFEYFKKIQVGDNTPGNNGVGGWFLQKTHVDGELEWVAVQLDQTAMPIMLGWKLWQHEVLNDTEAQHWYKTMLKAAADFLVEGGETNLEWNKTVIKPPYTQQERWEEQEGYSPSTMASVVAGLITAAELAKHSADDASADRYLARAREYTSKIEARTFTTDGVFDKENSRGDGRYYLRITQNEDPNDNGKLLDRNGRGELNEAEILDGGFLELVRYGVRKADDPHIRESLPEYDDTSLPEEFRVKYEFRDGEHSYPGWRRYGDDGYGENATNGENYGAGGVMAAGQRGRVWPFFTGERGHYELAYALESASNLDETIGELRSTYVAGMEFFANEGLMLPEQVWDGVGTATRHEFAMGEGTNSATPLAWTHAEYVKLLRSLADKQVWDSYPVVSESLAQ